MKKLKWKLIEFFAQFLAPCNVITELLSASRDRRLNMDEKFKLRSHLMFCKWCTDYGHQIAIVDDALKIKANPDKPKPGQERKLSESARQKIKDSLSGDSEL